MRTELIDELCVLAEHDRRIVLLTADLGFGVIDRFRERFPERFINVGVAEQSMIATATGLAEAGLIPYCYSIATFATLRPFEFIRNGPVAHRLPVRIVGIGPGMDYGVDGLTHFAIDDVGVLRSQPGLLIWAPGDASELRSDLRDIHVDPRPVYMRIPRISVATDLPRLHHSTESSSAVAILSLGDAHVRGEAIRGALTDEGIESSHVIVSRLDEYFAQDVLQYLQQCKVCVVVENHYIRGGLFAAVSEGLALGGLGVHVIPVGVERLPVGRVGTSKYMESVFMTSTDVVVKRVITLCRTSTVNIEHD